jgi:chlorite dismutase
MNRPGPGSEPLPEPTTLLQTGWHCLHLYYSVDAAAWKALSAEERQQGAQAVMALLDPERDGAPERIQTFITAGHGSDFGIMALDRDPLKLDDIRQGIRASQLGPALQNTASFVSLTEISEYVPTAEQYAAKLRAAGAGEEDPAYLAKVKAYEQRLPMMNRQRLYPDFPDWPVICFYPMNKIRHPQANWYVLPFEARSSLMAEHATSGIKFAGKVSQLITASTGFDNWEWGVTLWARTPEYVKEIVYTMRFDEASARYAEFGPFYIGYIKSPEQVLQHLRLI